MYLLLQIAGTVQPVGHFDLLVILCPLYCVRPHATGSCTQAPGSLRDTRGVGEGDLSSLLRHGLAGLGGLERTIALHPWVGVACPKQQQAPAAAADETAVPG